MIRLTCPVPRQAETGEVPCQHYLQSLPDALLTTLHAIQDTKDNRMILRCPSCSPAARFASLSYRGADLVYECLDQIPDLGKPVKYDKIIVIVEGRVVSTKSTSIKSEEKV